MKRRWSLRNLIDPIASHGTGNPLRTGVIVLGLGALIVILVFLNAVPFLDWQSGYTLKANFAEANNVTNQTPVRVDGVDVGMVQSLGPGPNPRQSSTVKMIITQSGLVIHSNATAAIRWRTVLGGNMYIDLNPGSPDAPKLNGAIPVSQTSNQVELDDVLRIYDGSTDQAQRSMLSGLSTTFGAPAQTDKSIDALTDLTTVGKGLAPYQGSDPGDLSKLVASTAHTVTKLGASTSRLENLVDGAAQTLGAVDDQSTALAQTIELGPQTLDSTKVTTARVDVTLNKLNPLVQNLEPAATLIKSTSDATRPALSKLNTVLSDAQPVLHSARPTLVSLSSAATTGTPELDALKAPTDRLNADILPWLSQRSSDTKLLNYESIGPFFSVVDEAAAEYDESGYRLHLSTLLGTGSVLDEADLTAGADALKDECVSDVTAKQVSSCGELSQILTKMLFGGKS